MAKYTVGAYKEQRIGNFLVLIEEDYFGIKSVLVKIYYCYIGQGFWGDKKEKRKLLYKAKSAHFKLEKAQKIAEDKLNEKLPIFMKMEAEGRIKF